uniref:CD40 ligand n=1 Tax=Pristiophorus japonicus TaxID=55135 RepID=UPI00398E9C45
MLRAANCSVKEGTVLTVSALADNMNQASGKSVEQQKACEHQPSVSVRVFIALIAFFLLAHMVTSALLYVYFSIKFDKVQEIINMEPAYRSLNMLTQCNDKKAICGERRSQLLQLFEKFLSKDTEEPSIHKDQSTFNMQKGDPPSPKIDSFHNPHRTAAHLIGLNKGDITAGNNFPREKGSPIKQWMAEGFPAFTRNINYTSGKLVINEPGLYYVYCQVSFRLTSKKTGSQSSVPFLQYIYLQRTLMQSTLLMKASKTPVDKGQTSSFNSVNQGGVFQLKKGDRLFVAVTNTSLLSYDKATYFGIFQL